MKITTWNVNGYRSIRNKKALDWVHIHQPDVLCLQEVKASPAVLTVEQSTLEGYEMIWSPAERPGYSGVATFTRQRPAQTWIGLNNHYFDLEGRLIMTRHPGFILLNAYFPSGQRGMDRVGYKLEFYAALLDLCDQLLSAGEQVIITGDFNTAHREIDLARPRQNLRTSGFMPEERAWVDRYLSHGFVDAYRAIYPEKAEYTWWSQVVKARERNVGWRLDYFLVSAGLMDRVRDVVIHKEIEGSDHCPVSLLIDTN